MGKQLGIVDDREELYCPSQRGCKYYLEFARVFDEDRGQIRTILHNEQRGYSCEVFRMSKEKASQAGNHFPSSCAQLRTLNLLAKLNKSREVVASQAE